MAPRTFFFAGGGTGGHIYPALAVAEQIVRLDPESKVHFFCSSRDIDSKILGRTSFEYTTLPATGFSLRPKCLLSFCRSFLQSCRIARRILASAASPTVIGIGGFVAAPVCLAAHRLKLPLALLNVDILPGRANRLIARFANDIFVQFEDTAQYFNKTSATVHIVGCPLRSAFENPQPDKAIDRLKLDKNKKTLLVTGASSGSENINKAVCALLDKLSAFADQWQIVHLTGRANFENVKEKYTGAKIAHTVLDYHDDMADLLAAADLLIGRSGAVSIAEYAAAAVPAICMPYPYHRDRHQYLNAGKLAEAGAAVIADDLPDEEHRAERLWQELRELMKDDRKRQEMKTACKTIANTHAACEIAQTLLKTSNI
ncbi:MAG TPA: UDP-N-acetylglucosamine--N-acetylmuramyl-(pentapeptide) pyrophosphoryl-undecaprenol N-acetylglucosamine transferase [Sedimentisphaerales bacterium]|nr:UDP-N-acetylglucosamine--N-acetylmuramyl-(pentapeptide) pyrophosphoryl-undecaprenol N-acetylglucosamine transferase [Sedimentisphaerales bacterium]